MLNKQEKRNLIKSVNTNDLRAELEDRGYSTAVLWHTDDIPQELNLSHREGIELLNKALTSASTFDGIWFSIDFEVRELDRQTEYNQSL